MCFFFSVCCVCAVSKPPIDDTNEINIKEETTQQPICRKFQNAHKIKTQTKKSYMKCQTEYEQTLYFFFLSLFFC